MRRREGDMKLVVDPAGKAELHDLSVDELERNDLYSQRGETVASLQAGLAAWERNVIAPRLSAFAGAER